MKAACSGHHRRLWHDDIQQWAQYGRAQEIDRVENGFIPAVRPLIPDTIYDLASLTKLFTAVVTLALVESGQLSLDETVGQIDPRFIHLQNVTVGDVLSFRISLQTPGRIDTAPTREEGLKRLFGVSVCPTPSIRVYSDMNAMVIKYVIEAKTGLSLFDAIQTWILSPAGMPKPSPPCRRRHVDASAIITSIASRRAADSAHLSAVRPAARPEKPCCSATTARSLRSRRGCSSRKTWFALRRRCFPAS
ncbi:MAG: serine hydrolase domain-containing protein [Christensenellales bacterium]